MEMLFTWMSTGMNNTMQRRCLPVCSHIFGLQNPDLPPPMFGWQMD